MAARTILNAPSQHAVSVDINPYRGCEIGCKYCYARYAMNSWSWTPIFEKKIYAKPAPASSSARELGKIDKRDHIAIRAPRPTLPTPASLRPHPPSSKSSPREHGGISASPPRATSSLATSIPRRRSARRNVLGVQITITRWTKNSPA